MLRAFTRHRELATSVNKILRLSWTQNTGILSLTTSTDVKQILSEKIPEKQAELKEVKKTLADKTLSDVKVAMCLGGMRGIPGLLWETSLLDPEEGIRFRY